MMVFNFMPNLLLANVVLLIFLSDQEDVGGFSCFGFE